MSEKNSTELPFLVDRALKYSEKDKEDILRSFGLPRIALVGIGGAGNNTINRIETMGKIEGVETIAINTDRLHLDAIHADKKVLIGKPFRGLVTGGIPELGRKAAELSRDTLEDILRDKDIVFITAGMGGGTGTGASPVIVEIAKKAGAIVIAMVTFPFEAESKRRKKAAAEGIEELRKVTDTVIVLENDKLMKYAKDLPLNEAFAVMDQLMAETVRGISETITQPSLVNFDFADIIAVLGRGDFAMLLVGETAKEENRPLAVVQDALSHPWLGVDCKGAKGALIHITGGEDLTMKETNDIVELLTYELDPEAIVIWGAKISDEYKGKISAIAIMTGVHWKTLANLTKDNMEQKTLKGLIKV
jgi:cell division protein FtsZ